MLTTVQLRFIMKWLSCDGIEPTPAPCEGISPGGGTVAGIVVGKGCGESAGGESW